MIRLAAAEDAKDISEIYSKYVSDSIISLEIDAPSEEEIRQRIENTLQFFPWIVCVSDGKILGYSYASKHNERAAYQWCANTAIYIRDGHQRRGIGHALYISLMSILKLQGFHAAHAGATLPNAGSVGLHESFGFQRVGVYPKVGYKFGEWHDVVWWQFPLRERAGKPQPLRSIAEVQSDRQWNSALSSGASFLRI